MASKKSKGQGAQEHGHSHEGGHAHSHAVETHGRDTHGHGHDTHGHDDDHHVMPIKTYLIVFSTLMVLLVVTLLAAIPDLGPWNLPIAMAIAVAKALVVMIWFMHLKFSSPLTRLFAGAAFFWLAILFLLTLSDYISRPWFDVPKL